jgi:hypothetical protein
MKSFTREFSIVTNNQEAVKLLPCPWCGKAPKYDTFIDGDVYPYCCTKGCPAWLENPTIVAWNTRAPTPREQELEQKVDELEQMLSTADPVYCPTCGHCGEEECCGPMTKCKDARPNHCLYGQPRKPVNREQELEVSLTHAENAFWKLDAAIHDMLAEALVYKRDSPDGPGGVEFITGEHTSESLALEAAVKLKELKAQNKALWELVAVVEEALRQSIPQEELNLSNYGHETVCRISRMMFDATTAAETGLAAIQKVKGGEI